MTGLLPAALFGLEVPAGDVMIPAVPEYPAAFRITMAAIDPSAVPEYTGNTPQDAQPRATLKIVRQSMGSDDDDDEDFELDSEEEARMLNGDDSEDDEESSDEGENGGPSDPLKSKTARKAAAVKALKQALEEGGSDNDMSVEDVNGASPKVSKGKGKATGDDVDDDDDDGDEASDDNLEVEEFVLCTLDPSKTYQQALDITIGEDERVFFKVSGTHKIYLTGNYVIPVDDGQDQETGFDLSPDEDELDIDENESDDLDDLEDPRITEIESDEEEVPKLVKKGKNKRRAAELDEGAAGLDEMMAKSLKPAEAPVNGDAKLSKKQMKKLKNNAGEAVPAAADSPNGKKVQFAKKLEQGPTGAKADAQPAVIDKKAAEKPKATGGVRTVQGVKIDDRKQGSGPAAKNGSKVSMRYIGKLDNGKQFDANKKGAPFRFTLGRGEVIKGWDIGIEGMSAGGERRITIPASLGYGNKSMPDIPKNSQLTFDVKMLEVK